MPYDCGGITWENFAPMLWVPLVVWAVVILLSFPLRHVYVTFISRPEDTELQKRQRWVMRYIGTNFENPVDGTFLTIIYIIQILASMYETFIYAARTYSYDKHWGGETPDRILAVFFFIAFMINWLKSGFNTGYAVGGLALVDIFTVTPIFLDHGWMSLKFLRINRALMAYENLERAGTVTKSLTDTTRALVVTLLRTLSITVTFAGVIFLAETLGEPEFLYSTTVPTAMGNLSFLQLIYWIFTTISTVGYGDFSPTTNVSQLCVILFIIGGVVFFSIETGRIIDVFAEASKGHGHYTGPGKHIVIIGGAVRAFSPTLRRFLSEMLPVGQNLVMLAGCELSDTVASYISDEGRGLAHYFEGSPMESDDLHRVRVSEASMAFVLANLTTQNADEEDRANILRAMNVNRMVPDLRMRVMLIRPANKMMAFAMGLPVRTTCSVNELKGNLMAQSCRMPGYSTMLLNLCITDRAAVNIRAEPSALASSDPWLQQYLLGNNLEVAGCVLDPRFNGQAFWEVAKTLKSDFNILLLAVQEAGQIILFAHEHVLQPGEIVFLIAESKSSISAVALHAPGGGVVDYRPIFAKADSESDNDASGQKRMKDLVAYALKEEAKDAPKKERPSNPKTRKPNGRRGAQGQMILPGFAQPSSAGSSIHGAVSSLSRITADERHLDRNKDATVREEEEAKAAGEIVEASASGAGHILLLLCQPDLQWQQVVAFIRPLRAEYLTEYVPIIVMGPGFPPSEMWDMFEDVCYVNGSPESRDELEGVGAQHAERVVLLAGPPNPDFEARLADSQAMVVNSLLEMLFKDHGVDKFCIFEYTHPGNALILPATPISMAPGSSGKHILDDEMCLSSPRFASGRIMVPSLFGSLFANAYETPGIMELFEALSMPSRREQRSFPFMLPPLIAIAKDWVGRTYGDLAQDLLENGLGVMVAPGETSHVMPIGLYRRSQEVAVSFGVKGIMTEVPKEVGTPTGVPMAQVADAVTGTEGMRFVYTNPTHDEVLLAGDQVYLLAPVAWGDRVVPAATAVAMAGMQVESIFANLANEEGTSFVAPAYINEFERGACMTQPAAGISSTEQAHFHADPGAQQPRMCGM